MATAKKPHQVTIKTDTPLWNIIEEVRDACATTTSKGTSRKAQAGNVLEGFISAVVESADASTLNRLVESVKAARIVGDRRGEYLCAVVESRNAAHFENLPTSISEIEMLEKALAAKKAQLSK